MPCRPQKQPPARTAVWSPAASAAGASTAGAGIALSTASAPARQAHPHAASARVAAMVLILLCIMVSLNAGKTPMISYAATEGGGFATADLLDSGASPITKLLLRGHPALPRSGSPRQIPPAV